MCQQPTNLKRHSPPDSLLGAEVCGVAAAGAGPGCERPGQDAGHLSERERGGCVWAAGMVGVAAGGIKAAVTTPV